jgi:hypothetical protein
MVEIVIRPTESLQNDKRKFKELELAPHSAALYPPAYNCV